MLTMIGSFLSHQDDSAWGSPSSPRYGSFSYECWSVPVQAGRLLADAEFTAGHNAQSRCAAPVVKRSDHHVDKADQVCGERVRQLREWDVADSEVHLKRAPSYRLLGRDVSAQPHMSVAAVQFQSRSREFAVRQAPIGCGRVRAGPSCR